jgi:hypothetical protein
LLNSSDPPNLAALEFAAPTGLGGRLSSLEPVPIAESAAIRDT